VLVHCHSEVAPNVLTFLGAFLTAPCSLQTNPVTFLACYKQSIITTPSSIPKYRHHNLVADVVYQNLTTGGEVGCFHCILCHFISGSKWSAQVSSVVTYWRRNLTGSVMYRSRLRLEVCMWICVISAVNILGTQHALLYPKHHK